MIILPYYNKPAHIGIHIIREKPLTVIFSAHIGFMWFTNYFGRFGFTVGIAIWQRLNSDFDSFGIHLNLPIYTKKIIK